MAAGDPLKLPRLVRAPVVARTVGIAYTSLRDAVFRGELPVVKIGRAWYFEEEAVRGWVRRQTVCGTEGAQ